MKEQGVFQVRWICGDENEVDLFTKDLSGSFFERHLVNFNGGDKIVRIWEGVGFFNVTKNIHQCHDS